MSNSHQHNDLARYLSHIRHGNERIAGITYIDYAFDREHCVAFCVDVEHATKLAEAFNTQNITSAVIHGALPKEQRKQLLKDFHEGKIRVLTNCQVLTEGWDEPKVNCIIHAAPTKSSLLYTQKTGRGTRLSPETGKVDCLIIDVVDITKRHSLVTVADLVGLPPKFDFKGEDLLEVAVKFEEAKKANQHLLMDDCQSLDEVKAKVEDVDLFIPEMPPVVREHAQLAWSQASPDHFTMSYHGENFPERVDLKQDMLGQWSVEMASGFKSAKKIAQPQGSLQEAFAAAEKWMSVNRGRVYGQKNQKAAWRKATPSNAQVREIRRQGIDVDWSKMNAGQVADMLDFRKAQALSRARQKVEPEPVAQCSTDAPSSVASAIVDSGTKQQAPDEDGRARTDPKVVACVPSSARDIAFASQCTSRTWSAHWRRSEAHIRQRPRLSGPRRKIRLADVGLDGVTQTILGRGPEFGEPTSNCMQAALATVFGLPLNAVPHFPDAGPNAGWWDRMNAWLAEHYGVVLVSCTAGTWEVPRVLHLTQGNTVRDVPHVVVAFGGQLLHDPHPSRAELSTVLSHELFLAVHPSGVDTLRCVPVIDALEVGQSAYPPRIPELALRTALAPSGVKRCTRCGVVKALGEFPRVPQRRRVSSWCRPCSYRSVKAGNERLRLEVLTHYSGGTMRCACCGQNRVPFLALDHIDGNGATHREEIGSGASFYRWLKQNRFPPGLQVLCHNCNLAKSAYGSCPHTRKASKADSEQVGESE